MENNKDKEISLGRFFKVMFNRKIPLIAITSGTILVGLLGIQFGYNKAEKIYKAEYKYNIDEFNQNGKYIDGSSYFYNSLASIKVLDVVKSQDDNFKNIDIERMIKKNAINLELTKTYDEDKNLVDTYFTLTINQSYFKNIDQAKEFFIALINYPINKNIDLQKEINYKVNLEKYSQVEFYENQLDYLENQLDYILLKYDNLISTYGDSATSSYEGKKISTLKNELNMYFINHSLNDLRIEADQKGYVKDYDRQVDILRLRQEDYKKTIKYNEKIIESLNAQIKELLSSSTTSQSFDLSSYNSKIAELLSINISLQKEIDDLEEQITNGQYTPESFTSKIDSYKVKLEEETDKYKEIEKEVMSNNVEVFFFNSNAIEKEGGISLIIGFVLTFIVGLMIGCVVNLILDRKYLQEEFPVSKLSERKKIHN